MIVVLSLVCGHFEFAQLPVSPVVPAFALVRVAELC